MQLQIVLQYFQNLQKYLGLQWCMYPRFWNAASLFINPQRAPWTGWLLLHEYGRIPLRSSHQIKLWWTELSVEATSGPLILWGDQAIFLPGIVLPVMRAVMCAIAPQCFLVLLISLMSSSALSSVLNQLNRSLIYEWSSFSAWIIFIIIWLELLGSRMIPEYSRALPNWGAKKKGEYLKKTFRKSKKNESLCNLKMVSSMKWLAQFPLVFCSMRVACHSQADGEAKPVNSTKFIPRKTHHFLPF